MTDEVQVQDFRLEASVVNRVMTSFVEALEAESGLAEVAARIRKTVVEDENYSEAALRQAMFGDADT